MEPTPENRPRGDRAPAEGRPDRDPLIVRAHFVLALLDPETSSAVQSLWARLARRGISTPLDDGVPPHLSLGGAEGLNPRELGQSLRGLLPAEGMPLHFSHLGAFGVGSFLWLGTSSSEQLHQLHRAVHNTLLTSTIEPPDPLYTPHTWVPHCTIARAVAPAVMPIFWEEVQSFALPRAFSIASLEVVPVEYRRG